MEHDDTFTTSSKLENVTSTPVYTNPPFNSHRQAVIISITAMLFSVIVIISGLVTRRQWVKHRGRSPRTVPLEGVGGEAGVGGLQNINYDFTQCDSTSTNQIYETHEVDGGEIELWDMRARTGMVSQV